MGRPLVAAADGPPGTGITDAISAGSDESRVGRDSGQRIGNIFGRAQRLCQGGPKRRGGNLIAKSPSPKIRRGWGLESPSLKEREHIRDE